MHMLAGGRGGGTSARASWMDESGLPNSGQVPNMFGLVSEYRQLSQHVPCPCKTAAAPAADPFSGHCVAGASEVHCELQVHLLVRGDKLRASGAMQDRTLSHDRITVRFHRSVKDATGKDKALEGLQLENTQSGLELLRHLHRTCVACSGQPCSFMTGHAVIALINRCKD